MFLSGMLLPWYIGEVKIVKQSSVEYRAEDGRKYIRRHGMTEEMVEDNVTCKRCGGCGHLARNCPSPAPCFHCSETGHKAANCPQNDFFLNKTNKVHDTNSKKPFKLKILQETSSKRSQTQSPKFCHFCEQEGHGIRECPDIEK